MARNDWTVEGTAEKWNGAKTSDLEINYEQLKAKIVDSGDFLVQEKLYLEKLIKMQIPMRVIRGSWQISKCPCCGTELGEWLRDGYHKDYEHLKICDCGQKLDWSYPEEDEEEAD